MKKFDEDLRLAVITTKYIFREGQPILYVFHHEEDGMWEFVGNQDSTEEDYLVVALEEIISFDESVLEISNLPIGAKAYRETKSSSWEIEKNDTIL